MTEPYDERAARRAYVHRRQQKVFSITGAFLVVAMVVALLFYHHVFGLGEIETAATKPNYGQTVPCAPTDSNGDTVKYPANRTISLRVLNGTTSLNLAKAVSQALVNRNFSAQEPGNYTSKNVERTTIYFGANAIAEAYAVNANFSDAVMIMDDRQDMLIDVVVGATFNDLVTKKQVPGTDDTIKDFEGCVAADKMTDLPKALSHTEVYPPADDGTTTTQ